MNDADLDLILGITNGRLTGHEKQNALNRIAAKPELAEELAAQIAAMHGLSVLEPAYMTPSEKAALRGSLIEQLHLEAAVPVVTSATPRRPWWQFALAPAAVLLVAIVVVPSMLSGSDDSSSDVVAIEPLATESVDFGSDADARAEAETDTKTDVTSAATTGDAADGSTVVLPHISEDSVAEFFASAPVPTDTVSTTGADDPATTGAEDAADEAVASSALSSAASTEIAVDVTQLEVCLAEIALDLPDDEHIPMAATLDGDITTIHLGVESGDDIAYSASIDLETCSFTSTTP